MKLGSENGVCSGLEGDIFEFVFVFSDCFECGGGGYFFPFFTDEVVIVVVIMDCVEAVF